MDSLIANRNQERNRVLESLQQPAHDPAEDPQCGYQQNTGFQNRFKRSSQLFSKDDSDHPEDQDDSDYSGAAGQEDSDEAGGNLQDPQEYGFKPLDGERMFFKEAVSYKGETAEGSSSSFPSVKVKEETEPVDPEVREQVKIDESDASSEENLPSRISSTQGRREQGVCK